MSTAHVERLVNWDWQQWVAALQAVFCLGVSWARHTLCALHGHTMVLRFAQARVWLQCTECGMNTPGWTIDVRPSLRIPSAGRVKRGRGLPG
jgi:hypothetical protein